MSDDKALDQRLLRAPTAYLSLYPDIPARMQAAFANGTPEVRVAAAAMLRALEAGARGREAALCERFDLTPAQARLAAHLAEGGTIATHAASVGISTATARQHLQVIFSKVGVNRQAELVAYLNERPG